jgi:hypothetical protein
MAPCLVSLSGPGGVNWRHLFKPNHVPPFMLTLFHHPMLASCRFIRLTFGEHGEEIQLVEEMPWTRRPEFLALNPAGGLPVLLAEGDVPVVGSYAIAEYLDETRGISEARQAPACRKSHGSGRDLQACRLVSRQDGERGYTSSGAGAGSSA